MKAHEFRVDQVLVSETQPQLRAAQASVLGKANAAVCGELARFDLADRCAD
jgi:hypothetical protein